MNETQLFLLRTWQERGQFRASLRGVDEELPRLFTEPAQLTAFLERATAAPALGTKVHPDPSGA